MRLRRKREDEKGEQLPLEEGKDSKEKKTIKKKITRDEGPKWISAAVLAVTIVAALWFWVVGSGGLTGVGKAIGSWLTGWGGSREYVIE